MSSIWAKFVFYFLYKSSIIIWSALDWQVIRCASLFVDQIFSSFFRRQLSLASEKSFELYFLLRILPQCTWRRFILTVTFPYNPMTYPIAAFRFSQSLSRKDRRNFFFFLANRLLQYLDLDFSLSNCFLQLTSDLFFAR